MSNTAADCHRSPPHIALLPSAGMGHLIPFLRLAATLSSRNCKISLITLQPTVSAAESTHIATFFATHPHISRIEFQIPPYNPSNPTTNDPFFLQFEAIRRSAHLLCHPLSSLSPPLSAIFSDFVFANGVSQIADDLLIPNYIVCTSSARFFSLMINLPYLKLQNYDNNVEISGLAPLPISSIPPPLFNPNHLFTTVITANAPSVLKAKAVFMNTFDYFDAESISALNNGLVLNHHPPVLPIGPLEPYELEQGHGLPWLDNQPSESVVYVSFGSRTAMSRVQIRELGNGLEKSGYTFLWVLKVTKVDKDDKEEVEELLGESFTERTKNMGVIVKGWVKQEEILWHRAVGGFVSHCGWNSVMEAARRGVPMLGWPQHGDQKINAEVVEKAGLGLWVRQWGWGGEGLVKGAEIGERIRELMGDEKLRAKAKKVGEEVRKAVEAGGSSKNALQGVIDTLKSIGDD